MVLDYQKIFNYNINYFFNRQILAVAVMGAKFPTLLVHGSHWGMGLV